MIFKVGMHIRVTDEDELYSYVMNRDDIDPECLEIKYIDSSAPNTIRIGMIGDNTGDSDWWLSTAQIGEYIEYIDYTEFILNGGFVSS